MWLPLAFGLLISATSAKYTSHSYPRSHGYSGSELKPHTYPKTHGLSGSNTHQGHQTTYHSSRTEVHHHYHYNPPQQVTYGAAVYPVYHGHPPVYVYEYRDSGSRYDSLLTGLALYNLGRMSANSDHNSRREYKVTSGEVCKLRIEKQNGEYEETRIKCELISSFIWDAEASRNQITTNKITHSMTETITTNNGGTVTTVKNETIVDAMTAKGPSIKVTPGMSCFMIRIYRDDKMKHMVDCALLDTYQRSLYASTGELSVSITALIICNIMYLLLN